MFVQAREGESFEELDRRFKRGIEASGILREYRQLDFSRSGARATVG
jgi:ribosomal protein S21